MSLLRRLGSIALTLLAVTAGVVLWGLRPPLPQLPNSLDMPVTTPLVQRLLLTAAWVTLLALLAYVTLRTACAAVRRTPHAAQIVPTRTRRGSGPVWRAQPASRTTPLFVPRVAALPRRAGTLSLKLHVEIPAPAQHEARAPAPLDAPNKQAGDPVENKPVRILVLGPFAIEGAPAPRRSSTRELIAYLALHPEGATRDQLLEALWPDADPRRSRPRLWQSTAEARRVLNDAFINHDGRYRLDRRLVSIDADELQRLLSRADKTGGWSADSVEQALALWRGDPLDGADYPWAESHARTLRATHVDLLLRAGSARLGEGDPRAALDLAERGIALDQLHEPSWRLALEAEAALGLRDAVTDRFERLTRVLDEHLGLRPQPETLALQRRLLAQTGDDRAAS